MIKLSPQLIRLGVQAKNKEEAIRAAGQVLVDSGHIAPGYVESMLGREGQANTYLGNGIAIPHGMQKDRETDSRNGCLGRAVAGGSGMERGPDRPNRGRDRGQVRRASRDSFRSDGCARRRENFAPPRGNERSAGNHRGPEPADRSAADTGRTTCRSEGGGSDDWRLGRIARPAGDILRRCRESI